MLELFIIKYFEYLLARYVQYIFHVRKSHYSDWNSNSMLRNSIFVYKKYIFRYISA